MYAFKVVVRAGGVYRPIYIVSGRVRVKVAVRIRIRIGIRFRVGVGVRG